MVWKANCAKLSTLLKNLNSISTRYAYLLFADMKKISSSAKDMETVEKFHKELEKFKLS
jgi:hypothetical protein